MTQAITHEEVDYGTVRLYTTGKALVNNEGIKVEAQPMADDIRIKVTVTNKNKNTGYVNYVVSASTATDIASDPHHVLNVAKKFYTKEHSR